MRDTARSDTSSSLESCRPREYAPPRARPLGRGELGVRSRIRIWGGRLVSKTNEALGRPTTLSCGLWPWTELARRHRVDLAHVCAHAGIEVSRLRQPFVRWPQVTCNRIAQFACDHFGADAAMAASLTVEAGQFQLLELLVRTAPTVAHGLSIGCWFFRLLHNGGRIEHERLRSGAHAITWVPPDYAVHSAYVELTFGVTMRGIQRETQCEHAAATDVGFRRPEVLDHSLYQQVLGCRPRFGAREDCMVISASVAALKMHRRNADVHRKARDYAQEVLETETLEASAKDDRYEHPNP